VNCHGKISYSPFRIRHSALLTPAPIIVIIVTGGRLIVVERIVIGR